MHAAALLLSLATLTTQSDTAYFQQGVAYRIEARLQEGTDVLTARAKLRYTNNSPSRIDTLWFHLSLNAFRPNSAWATRELQFDERRFTDLGPNDYAYERLKGVLVDGRATTPRYPGAPDSTVVAIPLATPIQPGDSITVVIDWDARLATTPRRQGRRGRHFDFAQWYPRIAVYDRGGWKTRALLPQGEFYGEFGSYDVTLDLAADQVVGATGVPVEGDPGWQRAKAPGSADPLLKRDAYPQRATESLGLLSNAGAGPGRKQVRWRAENVHHFAWTTAPDYIYEGGQWDDVAIHVLYQPGDTAWANGVVVKRTADALAFLDSIFGDYTWPQLTNVHRIEGGGTEFPMMVMNGGPTEGLIVHETNHQYVHGIFGNNEWAEGWLDEGFSSFLGNWYEEMKGNDRATLWGRTIQGIARAEQAGQTQPISMKSADFRDFGTYNAMTYTKPSIVYNMLRWVVGDDAFRRALHGYYRMNRLRHVRESDFRNAVEAAYGADLGWFFDEWIHTTKTIDYRLGEVTTTQSGGNFTTRVEIIRVGDAWMPVDLKVGDVTRRLDSREARFTATVVTKTRPTEVVLDPLGVLLDLDVTNNRKAM